MTRYTDEQAWVHRLMRCGWKYMPSLELIRHSPGTEERTVADVESRWVITHLQPAAAPIGLLSPECIDAMRRAEEKMQLELAKLLRPEAIESLTAVEREFERRVLGGD